MILTSQMRGAQTARKARLIRLRSNSASRTAGDVSCFRDEHQRLGKRNIGTTHSVKQRVALFEETDVHIVAVIFVVGVLSVDAEKLLLDDVAYQRLDDLALQLGRESSERGERNIRRGGRGGRSGRSLRRSLAGSVVFLGHCKGW